MTKKLTKTACFTDVHWGAKSNSEQHNQDCLNYVDWFCDQVKKDTSIDNLIFLGDWFENRSALNISTMNYSYRGAKKLNDLGLPVFFVIGNHDLYHRNTREAYSTIHFHEFDNFTVINEPTVLGNIGEGILLCPYLFDEEYASLVHFEKIPTWWGHFEFKGFVVTGYNVIMPTGPDPNDYKNQKRIFSGHFHKRQTTKNITYIGNTFPTNFSDADDTARGMMVYDHIKDKTIFVDWANCPKYTKTSLSKILDGTATIHAESRVKCLVDVPITYEESLIIREELTKKHNLREFSLEESCETNEILTNDEEDVLKDLDDVELKSVDELVIHMLSSIESEQINNKMLVEQYKRLNVQ